MSIINQPRISQLGKVISELLTSEENHEGNTFYIISAFLKRSGVIRIKPELECFRKNGGKIISIVGIDQKITSVQGLKMLFKLSNELYIFHSENIANIFHPKVYVLERNNQEAEVFIGSANLTSGGLYSNYEIVYRKKYNLSFEEERDEYEQIKNIIKSYKDTTSPCCKLANNSLIVQLFSLDYLDNEDITRNVYGERRKALSKESKKLFGDEGFAPPPPVKVIKLPRRKRKAVLVRTTGDGFWKKLSKFDVSTTSAPGQIIIPIRFLNLFPSITSWEITATNAKQAEVFFNIIFKGGDGHAIRVENVRAIHYIPAPHHPRPNQELRFTFRDKNIFNLLKRNDILEFKRTTLEDIWFVVRLIKEGTATNTKLSKLGNFGTLLLR